MDNPVIIKGNKSGIVLVLDSTVDFYKIIDDLSTRLKTASRHYDKNLQFALTIENRKLNNPELNQIINVFLQNDMIISDIIDDIDHHVILSDADKKETIQDKNTKRLSKENNIIYDKFSMYYIGNLKNGQIINAENSIIIIGSVLNGAAVISKGNVIILGSLYGYAYAGSGGRDDVFISALAMKPAKIRIADITYCKDKMDGSTFLTYLVPTIAYAEDGNMFMRRIG